MNLLLKSFELHLVREITIGEFQYLMFVDDLAWKNPKAFASFTVSQAVVSLQLFYERESFAW